MTLGLRKCCAEVCAFLFLTQPLFFVAMFLWLGVPVLGYICTLVAMKFYHLDKETMANVQKQCAEMRASKK